MATPAKRKKNSEIAHERTERIRPFRFKKGQSGNPSGRPKSRLLSKAYEAALEEIVKGDKTAAERIASAMIREALKGKVHAASEIADRTEGKPRQAVEVKVGGDTDLLAALAAGRERVRKARQQR